MQGYLVSLSCPDGCAGDLKTDMVSKPTYCSGELAGTRPKVAVLDRVAKVRAGF